MARKRHSAEEIISHLREVEVRTSQGQSMAQAIRSIGVTEQTYYRWRKEYGGLKMDQAKRLKELEKKNQRLRRAVFDLTLGKLILAEAAKGVKTVLEMVWETISGLNGLAPKPLPPSSLC